MKKLPAALLLCVFIAWLVLSPGSRRGSPESSLRFTAEESEAMYRALGGEAGTTPVTVFLTGWCPYCRALEDDLKRAGVKYAHADIEKNETAERYFAEIARELGPGIPVTVVGEKVFQGYAPELILSALEQR